MLRRTLRTKHPFFDFRVQFTPQTLMLMAGKPRVKEASAWAAKWRVAVPWLEGWATFALVLWDVARSCKEENCPYECRRIREDRDFAFQQALSFPAMLLLGEPPLIFSILQAMETESASGDAVQKEKPSMEEFQQRYFPTHKRRVSEPLPGPHPLLETRESFMQRAKEAWDSAIAALEKHGVSLKTPRKLMQHSEWLIRYQVLGETAAAIVKPLEKTDPSTVYKAIKTLATTIEFPVRAFSEAAPNLK